ncbi:MAG: fatty acid desaturase [Myxococcales bacterium]|nr:fatty acid desaturase [Myxococcales bacterium]
MTTTAEAPREGKALIDATRPYADEIRWLSWFHLLSGLALMGGGMTAAVMLGPWWARLLASVLVALCMLKLFIVYHDYMHRALLKRSAVAKAIMHLFGYFILAPPAIWKRTHDYHHANTAKMVGSQIGSFPTMSKPMYERLSKRNQLLYRLARHPLNILFGWLTVFLLGMCVRPFVTKPKENADAGIALVIYGGIAAVMIYFLGLPAYLLAVLLPHAIAAAIGSYMFYAQHNFPGITIRSRHDWSYTDAALQASSYMKMGAVMEWFSGNIGYHHVHHLNSSIPFYNLPKAMAGVPELQTPAETSLGIGDILRCLELKVWDADAGEMVGYPEE